MEGAGLRVCVLLFVYPHTGRPAGLLFGDGNVAEQTPGHQSAGGSRSADSASVYPTVVRIVRTRRFILASALAVKTAGWTGTRANLITAFLNKKCK